MATFGQLCLLGALVSAGYAAFLHLFPAAAQSTRSKTLAPIMGAAAFVLLSGALAMLAYALCVRDFRFDYVARYSSRLLPWHYALSALWVGQAGSLLLWAWMLSGLSLVLRFGSASDARLRQTAFGVLMGCLVFLVAVIVFAADPMAANIAPGSDGDGLSPLLQHPSMLLHPPIVFLGYAAWTIPFALAIAALLDNRLDSSWTQTARPWALCAWSVLGAGLLLGADWAYQELGWGGYWGWDPVENGSLMPWLTGTAFLHALLTWRRHCLKTTTLVLAIGTFALCIFATFLTRSGIFSSVHAFSQSPIGWMFLGLMAVLVAGGAALVVWRRTELASYPMPASPFAREHLVGVSCFLWVVLTIVVLAGTLVGPVSVVLVGRTILIGPQFYNNVLAVVGPLLLALTAVVPLLRWGAAPGESEQRALWICLGVSAAATLAGGVAGSGGATLALQALATLAASVVLAALVLDARRRKHPSTWSGLQAALREGRRQYAGFAVHLSIVALAIGITGSSLGSQRTLAALSEGETLHWAGRDIRFVRLEQTTAPDKLKAEALLEITRPGTPATVLRPARHLHLLQNEWTSEVAIESTWRGDFYAVLDAGLGEGKVALTLVENPLMRWLWFGGTGAVVSGLIAAWPARRRKVVDDRTAPEPIPTPPQSEDGHHVSPEPIAENATRAA